MPGVLASALLATAGCASGGDSGTGTAAAATCVGVAGPQKLDAAPERMISLSSSFTETIYAIGAEDRLFAVDTYSDYPAAAAAKEPRLDAFSPNVEAIAGYEPDVVLISYDPGSLKQQLCALGIAVWEAEAAASLKDVYDQIDQIGAIAGRPEEAANLAASMKEKIANAVDSIDVEGLSYYFEIDTTHYAFTSHSYQGELLALFGMKSIADAGAQADLPSQQLNAETIIAADPDVIILGDAKYESQSAATVAARPGWSAMSAVTSSSVIELDDDVVSRWGPRVVDLAEALAAGLQRIGS